VQPQQALPNQAPTISNSIQSPHREVASFMTVSKSYAMGSIHVPALIDIDLNIQQQSFTFIAGPSGSGKTTVLNLLGAIDTPTTGDVTIFQQPLSELNDNQLADFRNRYIGYIFQGFNLIPVLNVYENIEYPLLMQKLSARARREAVCETLAAVGLGNRAYHRPNELSGGQRQRVAVARALVKRPKLVLADEPTANLDSVTSGEMIDLMRRMQEQFETTFIFSTHDPELLSHANEVFSLLDGTVVQENRLSTHREVMA